MSKQTQNQIREKMILEGPKEADEELVRGFYEEQMLEQDWSQESPYSKGWDELAEWQRAAWRLEFRESKSS